MNLVKNISMRENFPLFFIAFTLLFSSGCVSVTPIYYDDDKKISQQQVEKFHQLYNDENYAEMYKVMSLETRKVLSQESFVKKFEQTRSDLGKVIKSDLVKSDVKPKATTRIVELIYETEFENDKTKELFIFSTDGKQAFIEVYNQPDKNKSESSQ